MIQYPFLEKGSTIGVTAPSSGVPPELHDVLKSAITRMETNGYKVIVGDTAWSLDKAKSASAKERAKEFNEMMLDENIQLIFPPWGGELLIEMLAYVDFENIQNKWILGYSDISVLLLAITLTSGIATAHGTNLVDLRGEYADDTTKMWEGVLATKKGGSIFQHSSERYQKEWQFDKPTPYVFHLTEKTEWKSILNNEASFKGRLLGGCIDVIRHLIGTPFGDVNSFKRKFINNESIIWYFENCDLQTTDLQRTLVQMQLAGWFENCSGIMFGRSAANMPVKNYTVQDVYKDLSETLHIPIIYDIDCGHVPPQMTLINGSYAEIQLENGKGTILQYFK